MSIWILGIEIRLFVTGLRNNHVYALSHLPCPGWILKLPLNAQQVPDGDGSLVGPRRWEKGVKGHPGLISMAHSCSPLESSVHMLYKNK